MASSVWTPKPSLGEGKGPSHLYVVATTILVFETNTKMCYVIIITYLTIIYRLYFIFYINALMTVQVIKHNG